MVYSKVVLLSGGLDSTVAMYYYLAKYKKVNIYPLYVEYGNRAPTELAQIKLILEHARNLYPKANIGDLKIIDVRDLRQIMVNKDGSIPKEAPYRNAIFTIIAGAYAAHVGAEVIVDGNHKEDALTGFADGTAEANYILNSLLYIHKPNHIKHDINILNPLRNSMKSDVVKKGLAVGAPLAMTTSCYNIDNLLNIHCGVCESCKFRKEAFKKAKVEDPTIYAI